MFTPRRRFGRSFWLACTPVNKSRLNGSKASSCLLTHPIILPPSHLHRRSPSRSLLALLQGTSSKKTAAVLGRGLLLLSGVDESGKRRVWVVMVLHLDKLAWCAPIARCIAAWVMVVLAAFLVHFCLPFFVFHTPTSSTSPPTLSHQATPPPRPRYLPGNATTACATLRLLLSSLPSLALSLSLTLSGLGH